VGAIAVPGAPADTAATDPKALVLQSGDVPHGFEPDAGGTRYVSDSMFAQGRPELKRLVVRSGRTSGYQATYQRGDGDTKSILSLVHMCGRATGAHELFSYAAAEQRRLDAARARQGGRVFRHVADVVVM